jgi:cytochrome c peroxidase
LPAGFSEPAVPADNPMSASKIELGRHLFYDLRLSDNQSQSCASCHRQDLAFTDGRATALGSTGHAHPRGAMSLANVAYAASLTWANPLFAEGVLPEPLERQSSLPIYGDAPVELGITSSAQLEARLHAVPEYRLGFLAAFPEEREPITAANVARALAAFERVIISGRSAYDRFVHEHDDTTLTPSARRGYGLFASERLGCTHCHGGFDLSDHVRDGSPPRYHNTGLYDLDGKGSYPKPNTGVYAVTREPADMGRFKAPTLRNIAVTAPYMHDGSIATLSEVLDHYAAAGRSRDNPLKDALIRGFTLEAGERADLLEFFDSLTDEEFLHDPTLADPWL